MPGRKVVVNWSYLGDKKPRREQKLLHTAWLSLLGSACVPLSSIQFLGWNSIHPLLIPTSFVTRELFSGNSANSLYDKAVADCLAHEKLADLLGEPVKAFGESTIQMLTSAWWMS